MVWLWVGGLDAWAQSGPELHGEYAFERGVAEHSGEADLTGVRVQAWNTGFSTPTPPIHLVADRWMAVQTLAFDYQVVRYLGAPPGAALADRLDLFRIRVGSVQVWTPSDRLTLVGLVEPGIFTDFRDHLRLSDFSVSVVALGSWSFSDQVSAGAGFGWLTSVGRPRLLPLVSARIGLDKLTIDLLLPQTMTVDAKVKGPLSMGLAGEFSGGLYRLHREDLDLPEQAYQEVQAISVGPTLSATLRERVRLTGAVSWQPRSRLSILDGRDTEVATIQLEPGWSVGARISLIPQKSAEDAPSPADPPSDDPKP